MDAQVCVGICPLSCARGSRSVPGGGDHRPRIFTRALSSQRARGVLLPAPREPSGTGEGGRLLSRDADADDVGVAQEHSRGDLEVLAGLAHCPRLPQFDLTVARPSAGRRPVPVEDVLDQGLGVVRVLDVPGFPSSASPSTGRRRRTRPVDGLLPTSPGE